MKCCRDLSGQPSPFCKDSAFDHHQACASSRWGSGQMTWAVTLQPHRAQPCHRSISFSVENIRDQMWNTESLSSDGFSDVCWGDVNCSLQILNALAGISHVHVQRHHLLFHSLQEVQRILRIVEMEACLNGDIPWSQLVYSNESNLTAIWLGKVSSKDA